MKLNYESKYLVLKNNYLYLNNFYTHNRWVKWSISSLFSKGEKKKVSMGLINKLMNTKLFGRAWAQAKYEHP